VPEFIDPVFATTSPKTLVFSHLKVKKERFGLQIRAQGRARTRQAAGEHGLSVQFSWTNPRKFTFAARTVDIWNKLPEDVKISRHSEIFKPPSTEKTKEKETTWRADPVKIMDNKEKTENRKNIQN
jgi:hypothetical protein